MIDIVGLFVYNNPTVKQGSRIMITFCILVYLYKVIHFGITELQVHEDYYNNYSKPTVIFWTTVFVIIGIVALCQDWHCHIHITVN